MILLVSLGARVSGSQTGGVPALPATTTREFASSIMQRLPPAAGSGTATPPKPTRNHGAGASPNAVRCRNTLRRSFAVGRKQHCGAARWSFDTPVTCKGNVMRLRLRWMLILAALALMPVSVRVTTGTRSSLRIYLPLRVCRPNHHSSVFRVLQTTYRVQRYERGPLILVRDGCDSMVSSGTRFRRNRVAPTTGRPSNGWTARLRARVHLASGP